jgi:hypothetical protein
VDRHDQSAAKPAIVKKPQELEEPFTGVAGIVRRAPLEWIVRTDGAPDARVDMDIVLGRVTGQKFGVAPGDEDVMTDISVR